MIGKQRLKSFQLLAYEALFRRLKKEYRDNQIFLQDYGKYYAGYLGEKRVDYTLSNFRDENIYILLRIFVYKTTITIFKLIPS